MKIAVDAMGGDYAPEAIVNGVLQALQTLDKIEITLVGDEQEIRKYIPSDNHSPRLTIEHTDEVITADDEPVRAVRRKKESSLVRVTRKVKNKEADACLSAGNTGAYMTAALLVVGRIKHIERPALISILPTQSHQKALLLDVGANVDAKPIHLLQYARMGILYHEKILQTRNPSVGLLNIGTESSKGNDLMKHTYPLLQQSDLHFVGNVEARDITLGEVDVIVCDGFSGNVALKSLEGAVTTIFKLLRTELTRTWWSKMGAYLLKPSFQALKKHIDYSEAPGAPLLGIDGICVKAHGSSRQESIYLSILEAQYLYEANMLDAIKSEVQKDHDQGQIHKPYSEKEVGDL